MRLSLFVLMLLFIFLSHSLVAQTTQRPKRTDYSELQNSIRKKFGLWLTRQTDESEKEFESRIKNEKDSKFKSIVNEEIISSKNQALRISGGYIGHYNAENQTLPIYFRKDTFNIPLPQNLVPAFQRDSKLPDGFNPPFYYCYVVPQEVNFADNYWRISKAVILFDNNLRGSRVLVDIKGFNLIEKKSKYSYETTDYGEGTKKYKMIDILTLTNTDDIEKEVYYYDYKTTWSNIQSLDFNYDNLNIIMPN